MSIPDGITDDVKAEGAAIYRNAVNSKLALDADRAKSKGMSKEELQALFDSRVRNSQIASGVSAPAPAPTRAPAPAPSPEQSSSLSLAAMEDTKLEAATIVQKATEDRAKLEKAREQAKTCSGSELQALLNNRLAASLSGR